MFCAARKLPANAMPAMPKWAIGCEAARHSTGHSSRLDRGLDKKLSPFGSADYSKEELVAEMGAAFLAAAAGISPPTIDQSAAYIDGWRKKLKGDKKLIVQAAGAGQRAADHVRGVTWDEPE